MIKLLYITNGISGSGGLERVLSIKASYLADCFDYEVHILSLNENGKTPFYEFSSKISLFTIPVKGGFVQYVWQYVTSIKKIIKTIKPDIISVCDDGLKGFFLPIILGNPCPMIYERHASVNLNFNKEYTNLYYKIKNSIVHKLMNWGAKSYNAFVVLTNGNLREWQTGNKMVIANPLSFYPLELTTFKDNKIIVVGSHSYNKGYDLLLEAWQIVISKHPDWQLEIYGKVDIDRSFIKMAYDLHLASSVTFFEPIKNIRDKYIKSAIMVLPSRSEGFGMVLIEAMACGVPCVSFDCPHGPADIITNGVDGFLVKNGDVQALAEKIVFLIENENLRKKMGVVVRENVKRYLPENIVPQWDELFKTLISSNTI